METMATAPEAPALRVRPARPADRPALEALLERSSHESRYRRFHGVMGAAVRRELDRIAHPSAVHRSWVADDGTALRGTATLAWGSDGVVEAAFLVEDDWFRRGVGRALFVEVAREAVRAGVPAVTAYVQADNVAARRFFRSVAPGASTTFVGGGELEVVVPVDVPVDLPVRSPAIARGRYDKETA